jgi:hypothetical protein
MKNKGAVLDRNLALTWALFSLSGSHIQAVGESFVVTCENFDLVLPSAVSSFQGKTLAAGLGFKHADSDEAMRAYLQDFENSGAKTLVVEDEISRRGDPIRGGPVAYYRDKVFRWCLLGGDAMRAVQLLRFGSSGYPLNAYVSPLSPQELSLSPDSELGASFPDAIKSALLAVIVSALDAETFLVIRSPTFQ